jgi:hypothetical protein
MAGSTWTADELHRIGGADEIQIAPRRADGTLRRAVRIWVVRVRDDLYVRSWRGAGGSWYRTSRATREGHISAGGVDRDVSLADVGDDVDDAVDARTEPGAMGTPPYAEWQQGNTEVRLVPFPEVGAHGELLVNGTLGTASLAALEAVGAANLAGKVVVDLAIPLDCSQGMPPQLTVANTDSLGEQIQRAFPDARVVKTLHTVFKDVMIEPARLPDRHTIFGAGDDVGARKPSRAYSASSAGQTTRSSTLEASAPRARPRCTCSCTSRSPTCSTRSTSTSRWSAHSDGRRDFSQRDTPGRESKRRGPRARANATGVSGAVENLARTRSRPITSKGGLSWSTSISAAQA